MITHRLQIMLLISLVLYTLILFKMLISKKLILKYSLTWIFMGLVLVIFCVFPGLLKVIKNILGVYSDVNLLFLFLVGLLMSIVLSLTVIVSRMSYRNKELIQSVAMLEQRVRGLENEKSHK